VLLPGAVQSDVVGGPADAEGIAAGGQFTHEVGQFLVVGVAAGFGAQHGHRAVGSAFPVHPEHSGVRVEKVEPGQVSRSGRVAEQRRVQRSRQRVRGENVEAPVLDEGRPGRHPVEDAGHAGPHVLGGRSAAGATGWAGGAAEVEQVRPFGLVEAQRPGERVEDALGDAGEVPALELRVVLHADTGQVGDLAAAQTRHAPVAAVARQAGPLGVILARRELRNALTSSRLSTPPG
jgi:hypothetical protein